MLRVVALDRAAGTSQLVIFGRLTTRIFGCVFAVLLAIGVSGCNIIITKEPLFPPGAPGKLSLKEGVWTPDSKKDCHFDETKPAETWPSCVKGWGVIRGDELLAYDGKKKAWEKPQQLTLSAGNPIVMQVHLSDAESNAGYYYLGISALALDTAGNATSIQYWLAQCGPPRARRVEPKSNDLNEVVRANEESSRTEAPLPGVIMEPNPGSDCTTNDPNVVRLSAKASKAWSNPESTHWVRAGYH